MTLPASLTDREQQKFVDSGVGQTAVRIFGDNISGTFAPTGLNVGGLVTEVTLNDTTWTALPGTALANRNAMAIQNLSGIEVKLNFNSSQAGYVGIVLGHGSERSYDITDEIVIYAKASSGAPVLNVEELA